MQKKYTLPKLYIPRDANGRASVAPGKRWYVWFLWRDPKTGKLNKKFKYTHNINRFEKASERKAAGIAFVEAYTLMLKRGFDPTNPDKKNLKVEDYHMTFEKAVEYAFEHKKNDWSEKTLPDFKYRHEKFLTWIRENNVAGIEIKKVNKRVLTAFLNDLATNGLGAKSINNFRAYVSSIFGKLTDDDIIASNPVLNISKKKVNPQKNKPFSPEQIKKIKQHLLKHDVYLYHYLKMVTYAFLRPVEVVRLTVGDIDLTNNILTVKSKTENRSTIKIIGPLSESLQPMKLHSYGQQCHLFTPEEKPAIWDAKESSKTDFFQKRFSKVKDALGFGSEYGIYSFRHTFTKNLYENFLEEGMSEREAQMKLMGITRHKSLSGLKNYLRDVGAFLPKDYSDSYSIEF